MIATTEILLIRHGETEWNAANRLQGHVDTPLNVEGERQAAALSKRLQDTRLDAIIASDLQRASQTACAIALDQNLTVQLDAGLRERCYGAFEGLNYDDIVHRFPEAHAAWQARDANAVFPAGERIAESLRQFQQRSISTILRHAQQHLGKKIALVTHGGVLECAYRMALSLPLDTPRTFPIPNASINRFTVAGGVLMLHSWGEVSHLGGCVLDEVEGRMP